MHYEVELKFRCNELERVRGALVALGAASGDAVEQADAYYRHPVRDFARTDEAFRLRRVGVRNVMTYKGPKVDATTKTRYEREAPLADGEEAFRAADDIVRRLGFEPVAEVRKRRQALQLAWHGLPVEAALDEVAGVGSFVELEASVDAPDQNSSALDAARGALLELAEQLGLRESERRSYLELLLAAPA
jgi:adenylate cyclase class 2